jgi:hypothetical protein
MKNLTIKIFLLFILAFGLLLSFHTTYAGAELSVEAYCQVCVKSMQQEVANIQELILLVKQYKNDPALLAEKEKVKQEEFEQAKASLFDSFGVNTFQYITYMGKHEQEVNTYLEKHLDIKGQIENTSNKVKALIDEYETLKGHPTL